MGHCRGLGSLWGIEGVWLGPAIGADGAGQGGCCGTLWGTAWVLEGGAEGWCGGRVWGSAKGWLWGGCVAAGHYGGQHGGCCGAVTPQQAVGQGRAQAAQETPHTW